MAATVQGRRLTEAHRQGQVAINARTAARLVVVWRAIDPDRLDQTAEAWATAALAVIRDARAGSAALAARYMTAFRTAEIGGAAAALVRPAPRVPADRAAAVLRITGPVAIKQAVARGVLRDRAVRDARARSTGEAIRQVADGGRRTVLDTVRADPQALGWARVASSQACAFCRMLSSRGSVYGAEATADFEAHGGCGCTAEPTYSRDAPPPLGAAENRRLYDNATRGLSGRDARIAFRRAVEGRG